MAVAVSSKKSSKATSDNKVDTRSKASKANTESNKSKESKVTQSEKVTEIMAKKKAPAKSKAKKEKTPVEELLNDNEHLKNAVQQIEKQFGDGSIMTLGNDANSRIRGISSTCGSRKSTSAPA